MATTENSEQSLIELVDVNTKFILENVYLNDLHALKRIKIKNVAEYPILVKLRSNLGNQISFQLNNENLENENEFLNSVLNDQSNSTPEPYSSNISLFSPINSYSDNESVGHNYELKIKESTYSTSLLNNMNHTTANAVYNQQFNQLFNYVGQIDEVQIEPGQTIPVIVEFLPENKEKINMQDMDVLKSERSDTFLNSYNDEDANYNFFEINGLLFFIAYRLDNILQKQHIDLPIAIADKNEDSNVDDNPVINENITKDVNTNTENVSINNNESLLEEINNVTSNIPSDQQITLKFRSKVCKSVLWIDIGETGISFDDCVLGGTYFKDFTLWNRSEIDLYWIMNITDTLGSSHVNWLTFYNYDTGEELDCKPLSAFAHLRIRVQFRPQEIGEFSYDFQIENANNMSNVEETKITSVVRAVKREESLVVSSGNILDFGDCCAGVWTKQQIILRNVSDVPLDINFQGVDADVKFKIKIDDMNSENKENSLIKAYTLPSREDSFLSSSRSALSELNKFSNLSNDIPNSPISSTMVSPTTTNYIDNSSTTSINVTGLGLYANQSMNEYSLQTSEVNSRVSSPNMESNPNSFLNNTSLVRTEKRSQSDVLDYIKWTEKINEERRTTLNSIYDKELFNEYDEGEKSNDYMQTEDIILKPRNEKTVLVYYRPEQKELTANYSAGRLTKQTFKIIIHYSSSKMQQKEKKKITCRARSCTSFIEVQPKVVNFGDTNVGTLRSLPIKIYNRSDLSSKVELRFISKVLNCIRGPYEIPARQSLEVKIDIYPRKVNPDYRKQITVVNHLNKSNNQNIEVQSTNIDKHGVTFHSLFYRIITSNSTNFIDLGDVILNAPAIRTFSISNISKRPLILQLTASLAEIGIYTENIEEMKITHHKTEAVITTERRKKIIENMADKRRRVRKLQSKAFRLTANDRQYTESFLSYKGKYPEDSLLLSRNDYLDLATLPNTFSPSNSNSNSLNNTVNNSVNSNSSSLIHVADLIGGADDNNNGNDDGAGQVKSNKKIIKPSSKNPKNHVRQYSSTSSTSSTRSLSITSLESYDCEVMRKNRRTSKSKSRSRSGSRNKPKSNVESLTNITEMKYSKSDYLVTGHSKRTKKIKKNRNKMKDFDDFFVVGSKKSNKILEKIQSLKDTGDSGSELERLNEKVNGHHYNQHYRTSSSLNINSKIDDIKDSHLNNDNENSGNEQNSGNRNNSLKHSNNNDSEDYESEDIRTRFNSLISAYESNNYNLTPILPKPSLEAEYVRSRILLRNELDYILNSNYLNPIQKIEIPPQSEKRIILIYIPSSQNKPFIQRKPRKQDAKIFIKLEEFDREIPRPQFETLLKADTKNIPVRELMIRFSLCRSVMDLGQKNINFGMLSKGDSKTKTIIIHNRSEASLLYNIKKSGSIASGDLVFNKGRMGIVSGYSTREVSFVFEPSLPGQYHEKLIVENINDRENNQILSVKANIKKTSNFSVETPKLDFGNCVINELCFNTQNVIIKSTCNKQRRYLEICYIEPEDVKFNNYKLEFEFEDEDELYETDRLDGNEKAKRHKPVILTKEMEEELEHLEQKLKIAKRKGRKDKVKKMQIKIERLKLGKKEENKYDDKVETEDKDQKPKSKADEGENEYDGKTPTKKTLNPVQVRGSIVSNSSNVTSKYKRTSTSFIFPIEPQEIKNITIKIFPKLKAELHDRLDVIPKGTIKEIIGNFMIIEHRNTDTLKKLPFTANLYFDKSLYLTEVLKKDIKEINDSNMQRHLNISQTFNSNNVSMDSVDGNAFNVNEVNLSKSHSVDMPIPEENNLSFTTDEGIKNDDNLIDNIVAEPESISEVANALTVEVASIDLGKLEINDEKDCYFTLSNNSDKPLKYTISQGNSKLFLSDEVKDKKLTSNDSTTDSVFELESISGEINGKETKRIDLTLTPFKHGRNEATIFVKEDNDKSEKIKITFQFYCRNESYLSFPDLDENALFNMKNCFVDYTKKYSKVTPFHVKNIYEKDLYLNCTSNLSQQCLIFTNESLEQPAQNILIKHGETIVVYIALQPNLGINRLINKSPDDNTIMEDSLGLCRTLIGGLRFSISIKENENDEELFQLLIQTVKFTTYIGQSLLMLSESLINFGFCKKIDQEFNSSFYITNLVPSLPLEYEIECSSDNIIIEDKKGIIEPSNTTESDESKLTTKDKKRIKFKFCPKNYGFINEYIVVKNVNNALQVSKINLRLFIDKNYLKINKIIDKKDVFAPTEDINEINKKKSKSLPQLLLSPIPVDEVNTKDYQDLQTILWNNVYVNIMKNDEGALYPFIQKEESSDNSSLYEQLIEVENTSLNEMILVPRSDLELQIRWCIPSSNISIPNNKGDILEDKHQCKDDYWNKCGPEMKLKSGQKVNLYISAPNPARLSSNEEINSLTSGKNIDINGALLLYDKNLKMDVMAFNLNAFYSMSLSHIDTTEIDIGKIGHANLWRDVPLSFELKNDSIAPLCVKLVLPNFIELENLNESYDNNLIIPAFSSEVIEAKVKPHNITDFEAGYRNYYIKLINKYNPENVMNVKIDMELTEFELRYERLNKGELYLPPLYHPYNAEALPCDNWFTILNSSDHDVKFELGFKLAHEIVNLVNVEILSRFSNSPVIGTVTLAAHTSMEVKVRAYSREDSKLDKEKCKNIVNVDGITFGKLWIITHQTLREFPYQSSLISALSETDLTSIAVQNEIDDIKNALENKSEDSKNNENNKKTITTDNELYLSTNRNLIDKLKKIIDKNKDILNDPKNRQILDGVPLKGKIIEGPTFSISNNRIEFRSYVYSDSDNSDNENSPEEEAVSAIQNKKKKAMNIKKMDMRVQTETFVITNLSKVFPLNFKVDIEYPIELMSRKDVIKLSPLDENNCGIVEPNGRLPITVEMLNSNIQGVSEDVKIHIYDVNSLSKIPINVYIGIIEESSNVIVPEEVNDLMDIDEDEYIEISQQSPEGTGFRHKKIKSISEDVTDRRMSGGDLAMDNTNLILNNNNDDELEEMEDSMDNKSSINTNLYANEDDLATNTNIDEEDDTWLSDIISVSSMQSIGDRSIVSNTLTHPYGNVNGLNKDANESIRKYNSYMMVRGCQKISDAITGKEVKRFYLLNFGQQDLGSTRISKKITLENISFEQVSYKISTICDHLDKSWIFLSRYEGILDFPRTSSGGPASGINGNSSIRRESHSITININSAVRGVYSTYIIIRNLYNPLDFKIIKVYVEIVAKHNLQRVINPSSATSSSHMFQNNQSLSIKTTNLALVQSNRVFDVYLNGMDAENTSFQLENLFYGRESTARSLVIFNRENVPLEFTIKSNLNQNNSFEVIFSLSRTSVKLYSVLTIQPLSSVRVYIRFRPDLPEDAPVKKYLTLEESNVAVKEEAEIYINCRLVKDYQLTIPLKAMIRMPQIDIPVKEFTFKGKISKKGTNSSPISSTKPNSNSTYSYIDGMVATPAPAMSQSKNEEETWNVTMKPVTSNIITVRNILSDELEFIVMNDSIYFDVEIVSINDNSSTSSLNNSISSIISKDSSDRFSVDKDKEQPGDEGNQDLIHDLTRNTDATNKYSVNNTSINNQMIVYVIPGGGVCNLKIIPRIDTIMRDINSVRRDKYLQEHLTIYNKKRPTEKVWIVLKMSFGNIIDFQSSSVQKSAYNALECRIIRLLREINRYIENNKGTVKDINSSVNTTNLYFKYHYLVDQLVYYGTREHSGDESFRLAILLFSSLFFYPSFGESLIVNNNKWIGAFTHFLNFFPYNNKYIDILRDLCFTVKNANANANANATNLPNDNASTLDNGNDEDHDPSFVDSNNTNTNTNNNNNNYNDSNDNSNTTSNTNNTNTNNTNTNNTVLLSSS